MTQFTKYSVIEYIINKVPEFMPMWDEHLEYWEGDEDKRTIGIDITEFQRFVENEISIDSQQIIETSFNIIELILQNCDEELEGVIYLFFLENLTNNPDEVAKYLPLLGPKSKQLCRDLDTFWGGEKTPGIYD